MRLRGESIWAHGDAFYVASGGGREAEPQSSPLFKKPAAAGGTSDLAYGVESRAHESQALGR